MVCVTLLSVYVHPRVSTIAEVVVYYTILIGMGMSPASFVYGQKSVFMFS